MNTRLTAALLLTVLWMPQLARAEQKPGPQAAPVTLTLRLAGQQRQFRPGEPIRIQLTFSSNIPQRFIVDGGLYDRSGRLTLDDFRLAPIDAVRDPLLDYFAASAGFIGGGLRSNGILGEKPFTITLVLNEWFRFDTPGTFSLSVLSHRVTDETRRTNTSRPEVPVESNTVSFEVLPRDARWEATELASARRVLSGPSTDARRAACSTLRYIASNDAVDDMVRRLDEEKLGCTFDFIAGLYSAPDRGYVVQRLEAGLSAADQPVTQSYLSTLTTLSVYVQHPELRPVQTAAAKGRLSGGGEITRRPELIEAAETRYLDVLARALAGKTAAARALTVAELPLVLQRRSSPVASLPQAQMRQQLIASFLDLPAERQKNYLRYQWGAVAGPEMVPVLRQLADRGGETGDLALRRLYVLDPMEGRARILSQIRKPPRDASLTTLAMLSDREIPELDNVLTMRVETAFDELSTGLLNRYASAAAAPRIVTALSSRIGLAACAQQTHLLAYLLRAAPDQGGALLERALSARARTSCYMGVLLETAALQMSPQLQTSALAHLDDPHPRVVASAIETLGRHGSAAVAEPLRVRFERWHRQWQGRASELRYNPTLITPDQPGFTQLQIERAFLQALGAGQGWLTSRREVDALATWCVSDDCKQSAATLASAAGGTQITLFPSDGIGEPRAHLAQYELRSIAALADKLAQYEKGTGFTLQATGLDPEQARATAARIVALAGARGLDVRIVP